MSQKLTRGPTGPGRTPPIPRMRGSAWYAMPMRKSVAKPRTCVWPWICRWSMGTSPPAAIRSRLIIPVVAPEGQRQEEGADDEVRREGERRALRGSGGARAGGDVADRGGADAAEELLERKPVDRREPGERLVRPVVAAAVSQAEALEDGDRRGKSPPDVAHRHRRRNDAVGLRGAMRGLEIAEHVGERHSAGLARVLERVNSAAAGVDTMSGERGGQVRVLLQDFPDRRFRIEE